MPSGRAGVFAPLGVCGALSLRLRLSRASSRPRSPEVALKTARILRCPDLRAEDACHHPLAIGAGTCGDAAALNWQEPAVRKGRPFAGAGDGQAAVAGAGGLDPGLSRAGFDRWRPSSDGGSGMAPPRQYPDELRGGVRMAVDAGRGPGFQAGGARADRCAARDQGRDAAHWVSSPPVGSWGDSYDTQSIIDRGCQVAGLT